MSSDVAIEVSSLGKFYPVYARPVDRLLQMLWRGRRRYYREFHALDGVDFTLRRGGTLGIIGRNGAGKSTLLQLICGTLTPTTGSVRVHGRIAALLELGAGFNPEFTGRENVVINAAILGLTPREIDERLDAIFAFADIGEFVDQPVKTYSSGMYVRLAFAVAIHVSPDILVVDEALSVGDAFFQAKCMARIRRMLDDGVTLLFISHDIAAVKALCSEVLWLDHGRVRAHGATDQIAALYAQDWIAQANQAVAASRASTAAAADAVAAAAAAGGIDAQADSAVDASVNAVNAAATATVAAAATTAGVSIDALAETDAAETGRAEPPPARAPLAPVPEDFAGRAGDGRARIVAAGWRVPAGPAQAVPVEWGDRLTIEAELEIRAACDRLVLSYHVKDRHQQHLLGGHTADAPEFHGRAWRAGERVRVRFELPVRLHEGAYTLTLLVASIGDQLAYTDAVFLDWIEDISLMRVAARTRFPLSDLVELDHELAIDVIGGQAPAGVVGAPAPNWLVLDDFFPNLLTGFRVAEYNALLDRFPGLRIASSYAGFAAAHAEYAARYPRHAARVLPFAPALLAGCDFAYLNFLNNAVQFLPFLEARGVPFAMTLYPGGGFGLGEPESDLKLERVLASPLLRGVLFTQSATRTYLHGKPRPGVAVEEVFGVVTNPVYFEPTAPRTWFGAGKATLDLAFVAEKYMPRGENKGFPAFVEGVGRWLATLPPERAGQVNVHVVGSFDAADWRACAPSGLADLPVPPRFHGRLETHALRHFLAGVDLVVSPNRPFVLHSGNFDGFPTGCCVEGALCGAAFAAADALDLNEGRYRDGVDFLQIEPDAAGVAAVLARVAEDPACLRRIGESGREVTRRWFDPSIQIGRRIDFLGRQLAGCAAERRAA